MHTTRLLDQCRSLKAMSIFTSCSRVGIKARIVRIRVSHTRQPISTMNWHIQKKLFPSRVNVTVYDWYLARKQQSQVDVLLGQKTPTIVKKESIDTRADRELTKQKDWIQPRHISVKRTQTLLHRRWRAQKSMCAGASSRPH